MKAQKFFVFIILLWGTLVAGATPSFSLGVQGYSEQLNPSFWDIVFGNANEAELITESQEKEPNFWEPDYLQPKPEVETGFGKIYFLGGTLLAPTTGGKYTLLYGGELGFALDNNTIFTINGYAGNPAVMNDVMRAITGKDQIAETVYWFGAGIEQLFADFILVHLGVSYRQADRPSRTIVWSSIPNLPQQYKGSAESQDIGILADLGLGLQLSIANHVHVRAIGMFRPTIWGTTSGTIKSEMAIHSLTGQLSVGFSLW
jgi:hypothetical protein